MLKKVDIDQVDSVVLEARKYIMGNSGDETKIEYKTFLLKKEQAIEFGDLINDSKCAGLYKYLPQYTVTIYLKGNKTRNSEQLEN